MTVSFQSMLRHGVRCEYFTANSNFVNFLNVSAFNTKKSEKSIVKLRKKKDLIEKLRNMGRKVIDCTLHDLEMEK